MFELSAHLFKVLHSRQKLGYQSNEYKVVVPLPLFSEEVVSHGHITGKGLLTDV